jgi:hypothetical protein
VSKLTDIRERDLHHAVPAELARNAMQQLAGMARARRAI